MEDPSDLKEKLERFHPEIAKLEEQIERLVSGEIDSKRFKAELEVMSQLQTIKGLKIQAINLAYKKGETHVAGLITEVLLPGALDPEDRFTGIALPFAIKDQIDPWKPFFETYDEEQLEELLADPKQAKTELDTKIKQLREQLKRLKGDVEG